MTNVEIANHTSVNNIVREVMRRWIWLGHVLCMSRRRFPQVALKWTPSEKRQRGSPLGTWRRTVEEKRKLTERPGRSSAGLPKTIPAGEDSLTPYAPAGAKRIK